MVHNHTPQILDELVRLGFSDEVFRLLHHFRSAGTPISIARHREYCSDTAQFRDNQSNARTQRRLEFVLHTYRDEWKLPPGNSAVFRALAEAAFLGIPPTITTASAQDFRIMLELMLQQAAEAGALFLDINSGELHRRVGGYPGPEHRMPICCQVMRMLQRDDDTILSQPPKANGASLTIRYNVPR